MNNVTVLLAVGPKGTMSCSVQGQSVRTPKHPSIPPDSASHCRALDGWTDVRIDGQTIVFPGILHSKGHIPLGGAALPTSKLPSQY